MSDFEALLGGDPVEREIEESAGFAGREKCGVFVRERALEAGGERLELASRWRVETVEEHALANCNELATCKFPSQLAR